MPSFIRANVLGHCGKELYVNEANTLASFSIGTNYKEKDEYKPLWVKVLCFGQQIEFAKKGFKKGVLVLAEGDMRVSEYKSKDNEIMKELTLTYAKVTFLDKKEGAEIEKPYDKYSAKPESGIPDDDIPF